MTFCYVQILLLTMSDCAFKITTYGIQIREVHRMTIHCLEI